MEDWRLHGEEDFLENTVVYEIKFPEFWEKAYRKKDSFYRMIQEYANTFVQKMNSSAEYLEGDKIQYFWHEHCIFCWDKAMTDKDCLFYCTEDMKYWICEKCFNDFKEKFKWIVKKGEDLSDRELHCQTEIIIANK